MTERHIIEPHPGDKRYVRRDKDGTVQGRESMFGKSLAADQRSAHRHEEAAE